MGHSVVRPDPSTMPRVMVRYSNHEALDRWCGVKYEQHGRGYPYGWR